MKKFIVLIVGLLALCSCKENVQKDSIMSITYRMYYPGNVVEKTSTLDVTADAECDVYSYNGTNYLRAHTTEPPYRSKVVESSTVPIELLSYEITKKQ